MSAKSAYSKPFFIKQLELVFDQLQLVFETIATFLFKMEFWGFYGFIFLCVILKNGVLLSPQASTLFLISQNIFANPLSQQPHEQWLLASFLGPFLGYISGANQSLLAYTLMHLCILIIFFAILIAIIRKKYNDFIARCVLILFFLSPLSSVLLTKLGSPDVLTVLLATMLIICADFPALITIPAFFLGVNHPEQGLVIILLLMIYTMIMGHQKQLFPLALAMLALLGGKFAMSYYFNLYHFNVVYSRLDFIFDVGWQKYLEIFLLNPWALFISLHHIVLIFFVFYLIYFREKKRLMIGFLVYNLLAFGAMFFTFDQTRVFSILAFPSILLLLFFPPYVNLCASQKKYFQRILTIFLLMGIFLPRFVVWSGEVYIPNNYFLAELIHQMIPGLLFR